MRRAKEQRQGEVCLSRTQASQSRWDSKNPEPDQIDPATKLLLNRSRGNGFTHRIHTTDKRKVGIGGFFGG